MCGLSDVSVEVFRMFGCGLDYGRRAHRLDRKKIGFRMIGRACVRERKRVCVCGRNTTTIWVFVGQMGHEEHVVEGKRKLMK